MTEKTKKREIVLLTPMRGIAAIVVVLYHTRLILPNLRYGFLFERGYLWVDFFFILSGFILSYVYRTEIISKRNYKSFFWARFGRIYPLHIFVLTLFVTFEASRYFLPTNYPPFTLPEKSVQSLIANVLLIHSWGIFDHLTWNHPSWSISTEWAAYILFPFLCFFTKKWTAKSYVFFGIIAILLLFMMNKLNGSLDLTYDYGFFRCFFEFFLGTVLYFFYTEKTYSSLFRNNYILAAALVISIFFMSLPLYTNYDFLVIIFFSVLIMSLASYEEGFFSKLLGNRYIKRLGDISYSVYLTHVFILEFFFEIGKRIFHSAHFTSRLSMMQSSLYVLFILTAVIIFSNLTYLYIEKPARIFLKNRQGGLVKWITE